MKYSQINEGVEFGDLQSLVSSDVSVAEFEPKTGTENDVVVIGFFCKDEAPANDIATFIEKAQLIFLIQKYHQTQMKMVSILYS
jgi:hypothetical protein